MAYIDIEKLREPKEIDFVIEPHKVTEKDHLAMLAFIAACKDSKADPTVLQTSAPE
jgi:hypothetical protein